MEGEVYFNRLLVELSEAKEDVGKLYERLSRQTMETERLERELKAAKEASGDVKAMDPKEKLILAMVLGNKLEAIKLVREQFSVGLSAGRWVVENTNSLGGVLLGSAPVLTTYARLEHNVKRAQAWVDNRQGTDFRYEALCDAMMEKE